MKNYFIYNPVSGSKSARNQFLESLSQVDADYELIETSKSGDGGDFAKYIARSASRTGEKARIFACGGDGTVNEVINGAIGFDNVEIGVIPLGTGNDTIRNFADKEDFLNVPEYIKGKSVPCDTIEYKSFAGGEERSGHCINMFNIGLDCNVVDLTEKVKKVPLITGSMSYLVSVFLKFVEKKGTSLRIEYDDGTVYDDKLLLISIGNGSYCGGGIKGLPLAILNDGLMDASLVKNVTRRQFLKLFPLYSKGTHLSHKLVTEDKILDYKQCESMSITSNEGIIKVCVDGEIFLSEKLELKMAPASFKFIVPDVK